MVKKFLPFMETKGLLLCSQSPTYPEIDEASPQSHNLSLKSILIVLRSFPRSSEWCLPSSFLTKILHTFLIFPICKLGDNAENLPQKAQYNWPQILSKTLIKMSFLPRLQPDLDMMGS